MIGVILFDHHDDLLYVYSDDEFRNKIKSVADSMDISNTNSGGALEEIAVMQMFSPLLTSYRVMSHEFQNCYDAVTCEDGSSLAFYEQMNFLLVAVASRTSINAVHLVRATFRIMQHVVGPSLSMLKNSDTHSELTTLLIGTFLRLRQSSQSIATESLHYEPIREEDNSSVLVVLQQAVADLNLFAKVPENRIHILVIKETSIIAIYSGKGTYELKIQEILFLIIAANAFTQSNESTRNSLIILDSCVPYTIHIQRVENGLNIIVLIELGLDRIANSLHSLLKDLTCNTSTNEDIPKKISQIQTLVKKLHHNKPWSDTLNNWRINYSSNNQSAASALSRQIRYGYELICLSPALLFSSVEHVSAVIDGIQAGIPSGLLSQPCLLTPILQLYPGLVHFVLLDRMHHRMIAPRLTLENNQHDSTLNDMWQMFHTSLDWLNEGMYHLLWNDKNFYYSHSLWVETAADKKIPWKSNWDTRTGTLGYPAIMGSNFYENLLKSGVEDEEVAPAHYLQLFCVHLGITSPSDVLEQAERMTNHLKRFIYPAAARLEDIL